MTYISKRDKAALAFAKTYISMSSKPPVFTPDMLVAAFQKGSDWMHSESELEMKRVFADENIQVNLLGAKLTALEAKLAVAKSALEFYAKSWDGYSEKYLEPSGALLHDRGTTARAALDKIEGGK